MTRRLQEGRGRNEKFLDVIFFKNFTEMLFHTRPISWGVIKFSYDSDGIFCGFSLKIKVVVKYFLIRKITDGHHS